MCLLISTYSWGKEDLQGEVVAAGMGLECKKLEQGPPKQNRKRKTSTWKEKWGEGQEAGVRGSLLSLVLLISSLKKSNKGEISRAESSRRN